MTGANYTGGKRWVPKSVSDAVLSQPVLSLLPETLPERDFATRLVVLRKATLAGGALKSLAVVWEPAHNPRRKSHLEYLESFSNMLRGNFPIYQNICAQTGRKHLTRYLARLRLSFQNTLPHRLRLCTRSTVRAVSPSGLIQFFFSRLGGTFSQDPSPRAEANRVLKFSRTFGLCNYRSSSRRYSGLASPTSDVDSESKVSVTSLHPHFGSSGLSGSWALLGNGIATMAAP